MTVKKQLPKDLKITVNVVESFKNIEEKLIILPDSILNQIEHVEFDDTIGLICIIRNKHDKVQEIILPKGTTQIHNFDDFIAIYCGEFLFKLLVDKKYNFVFLNDDFNDDYTDI